MGPHERISDRSRLQPSIRREETMTMSCSYFHVNRVFHVDAPQDNCGGWYFEVRDGTPHGPYASRALAEMALEGYLSDPGQTPHARRGHH